MNKFHRFINACQLMVSYSNIDTPMFIYRRISIPKVRGVRYSKRMLTQQSAVDMYLLIRAALHKKFEVVKTHLSAFNYAVPDPDR